MSDLQPLKEIEFEPSTLETVDFAVYEWLNEKINIHASSTEGWKKVPVIWTSAERAHQLKNDKDIRDSSGMIKYPIISVERTSIDKDVQKRGALPGNVLPINDEKGGTLTIARRIQQEKTSNFNTADRNRLAGSSSNVSRFSIKDPRAIKKVVYETVSIPMPVPIGVNYTIFLKSDYVQQMNEMLTPFITFTANSRYLVLNKDGHRFEAFLSKDFAQENNFAQLNEERKTYGSKITLEVHARLVGLDKNDNKPKVVIRENAVEVKIPRERVIFGDIPEYADTLNNKINYKE